MTSTSDASDTMEQTLEIQLSQLVLQQGFKGKAVEELQNLLFAWGIYTGPIDGEFGYQTEHSVKKYQRRVFLEEDGIVAERTWRALYTGAPVDMPQLSKGCYGELVKKVQRILKTTCDYIGRVDGNFGDLTESALTSFQRRCELSITGVVEESTWCALSKVVQ
ncbi:peptidoglycan-binding domain-containing protein [Scytonema sp. PRP1]|uniref:peptidoglycan-binding domain-containing protein n=1 Tax=Scytonema sp. PRP1 TaxID=3120513 RepID=UPI002FD70857